ncbi:MAG: hypothetical protein PHC68_14430 [Syntrophorhabdaceae bacterium]|nr:hypothetical protein [Syntrophorhabdaceae bacterium]
MTKSEREEQRFSAIVELRKLLPAGSTVYVILRSVSRSGMSRIMSAYTIKNNKPIFLDGCVAPLLELPRKNEGMRVTGCGMDMGFWLVSSIAKKLGYDTGELDYRLL